MAQLLRVLVDADRQFSTQHHHGNFRDCSAVGMHGPGASHKVQKMTSEQDGGRPVFSACMGGPYRQAPKERLAIGH